MILQTLATGALGLVSGYVHTSLVESLCHNYLQHASRATRDVYEQHPILSKPLMDAWKSHTMGHHVLTFRKSQTEMHHSLESELDATLYSLENGFDPAELNGLTVNWRGFFKMLVPFAPLCGLAYYFLPAAFSVPFAIMALHCPAKSKWIHPWHHVAYELACRFAPAPVAWYLRTFLGRFEWVYHDMHHRKPSINFNLAGFLGDLITGRMKWPTAKDWEIARLRNGPSL
ncbi:MAG TPA: hypothetical protein VFX30_14085 [bacterium]|nr:hypothetical protein [bacterium]